MLVVLETVLYSLIALLGLLLLFSSPGLRKDDLRSDDDAIKILGATITFATLGKLAFGGMAGYGILALVSQTMDVIITTTIALVILMGAIVVMMVLTQGLGGS